jgi:transcriptional regulator with GAF, ATPase, and Fis domain
MITYLQINKKMPYIPINCSAIATDLFESEMFGHMKGAFTGADREKKGKVELAAGGVLFLDEIGDLRQDHQAKLLRFLQEREYTRVAGYDVLKVNAIVIAATNIDLNLNSFRQDLYDRLSEYIIRTTPLTQRYEDVVFYVSHFGKGEVDPLTKCLLYSYDYPGNVRELRNLVNKDNAYCLSSEKVMLEVITQA